MASIIPNQKSARTWTMVLRVCESAPIFCWAVFVMPGLILTNFGKRHKIRNNRSTDEVERFSFKDLSMRWELKI